MRVSLLLQIPPSEVMTRLTAADWTDYMAASELRMLPDWQELRDWLTVIAGGDPRRNYPDQPQDMREVYRRRKAQYGRTSN